MNSEQLNLFRRKVRIIEREFISQLKDDTTCCGVTLAQCHVLMELGLAGEMSISQLAETLRLDKSTLSRTVDGMVKPGFLTRDIDSRDRRYMVVKLTEKGKKLYNQINSACNEFYQQVFEHISVDRHDAVIENIGVFADAFSRTTAETDTGIAPDPHCAYQTEGEE